MLRKKQEILAVYNKISAENKPEDDGIYRFKIEKGNGCGLIKKVLERRPNWKELE